MNIYTLHTHHAYLHIYLEGFFICSATKQYMVFTCIASDTYSNICIGFANFVILILSRHELYWHLAPQFISYSPKCLFSLLWYFLLFEKEMSCKRDVFVNKCIRFCVSSISKIHASPNWLEILYNEFSVDSFFYLDFNSFPKKKKTILSNLLRNYRWIALPLDTLFSFESGWSEPFEPLRRLYIFFF